jgi:hypothetical protein
MERSQQVLWRVLATVKPKVECDKMRISGCEFGPNESIALDEQLEAETRFLINVISDDKKEVYDRANLLIRSFLALISLDARPSYSYNIGRIEPVQPIQRQDGTFPGGWVQASFRAIPRPEDWDMSVLTSVNSALKKLDSDRRSILLHALNFLYDALTAPTEVESFLLIYGAISYLNASIGRGKNSNESAGITFVRFKGTVLSQDEAEDWLKDFYKFHTKQYDVIKSNKVEKAELRKIEAYYKKFLLKCIEYYIKGCTEI